MKVCVFCDEWGSAAYPENRKFDLLEQVNKNKQIVLKRSKARKFLIYFQAYTYTYQKVAKLYEYFDQVIKLPEVCGIVVGTRPDCISDALLDMWNQYAEKTRLFVEFGVQSFDNQQLEWMERGHSGEKSIWAIKRVKSLCPKVNLGIHLMFGLPWETNQQIIETAKLCSGLPIDNIKLHNTHVLKNTPLELMYKNGAYQPIELKPYAHRVMLFLQHLRPDIAIHRLTANSSRRDELIAPKWTGDKMYSYQFVLDYLNNQSAFQGQHHSLKEEKNGSLFFI